MTQLIHEIEALRDAVGSGRNVGFVPTMGFLHEGHLDLIRRAKRERDLVVTSIFVNRLQFGPSDDFDKYPRDLESDLSKAGMAGTDLMFAPSASDMYPSGAIETRVHVGRIGEIGEGRHRPGHFDGVATVCTKLFSIVGPCHAYFGRKDAQQVAVVEQVVRDLDLPVVIVPCETVREPDGLAMSSRNIYLSPEEREAAVVLSQALFEAELRALQGERSAGVIEGEVRAAVTQESLVELQYVEVCDPRTFERIDEVKDRAIVQLAAYVGETRLIDNVLIEVGTGKPA